MGLLNVSHNEVTQSVIDLQSDLLKNPYYLFNDRNFAYLIKKDNLFTMFN